MLLEREEIRFDFGDARFELPRDREMLGWVFSQFLYGEVTGIQVGHWIHHAPDLESAGFLARQCVQELSHVRLMRTILARLEVAPQPAHRLVRWLSTDLMGKGWAEHVCLEMALGEGYVLAVLYALLDTIPDPQIVQLLHGATRQEETHVAFGEKETSRVAGDPAVRRRLLGMSLVSLFAMRRLGRVLGSKADATHPVWRQLQAFTTHQATVAELRLRRMGLLEVPLEEIPRRSQWGLVTSGILRRAASVLRPGPPLLTRTYLQDPSILHPRETAAPSVTERRL